MEIKEEILSYVCNAVKSVKFKSFTKEKSDHESIANLVIFRSRVLP